MTHADTPWSGQKQIEHVQVLLDSFARLLGRDLIPRDASPADQAQRLFESAFVVC
jgi:hypothetical protein